jgi:hypothetical protein
MSLSRVTPRDTPLSGRTRNGRSVPSSDITTSATVISGGCLDDRDIRKKTYKLNKQKAVQKKLEHTNRPHVKIWPTDGGIRGSFSTSFFQLFQSACEQHYNNYPGDSCCTISPSVDNEGTTVTDIKYTVYMSSQKLLSQKLYTLNVYITTSGMLVNGKTPDMFLDKDLPAIQEIAINYMNGDPIEFEDFSERVAEALESLLDCYAIENTNSKRKKGLSPRKLLENTIEYNGNELNKYCEELIDTTAVVLRGGYADATRQEKFDCLHCNNPCTDEALYCNIGNHWLHYSCEELTKQQIGQLEDEGTNHHYICKSCRNLTAQATPSRSALRTVPVDEEDVIATSELLMDTSAICDNPRRTIDIGENSTPLNTRTTAGYDRHLPKDTRVNDSNHSTPNATPESDPTAVSSAHTLMESMQATISNNSDHLATINTGNKRRPGGNNHTPKNTVTLADSDNLAVSALGDISIPTTATPKAVTPSLKKPMHRAATSKTDKAAGKRGKTKPTCTTGKDTDTGKKQEKETVYSEWEKDLQKKDKGLRNRERLVMQQEIEVIDQTQRVAELKTLVVTLEQDIKSIRVENRDLRLHVGTYPDKQQAGDADKCGQQQQHHPPCRHTNQGLQNSPNYGQCNRHSDLHQQQPMSSGQCNLHQHHHSSCGQCINLHQQHHPSCGQRNLHQQHHPSCGQCLCRDHSFNQGHHSHLGSMVQQMETSLLTARMISMQTEFETCRKELAQQTSASYSSLAAAETRHNAEYGRKLSDTGPYCTSSDTCAEPKITYRQDSQKSAWYSRSTGETSEQLHRNPRVRIVIDYNHRRSTGEKPSPPMERKTRFEEQSLTARRARFEDQTVTVRNKRPTLLSCHTDNNKKFTYPRRPQRQTARTTNKVQEYKSTPNRDASDIQPTPNRGASDIQQRETPVPEGLSTNSSESPVKDHDQHFLSQFCLNLQTT